MNKVTIEFFHDVICSFCFPMSYRMRQLQKMMPEVEIVHRSFALVKEENDFDRMFGSRTAAKEEILGHWEHANQNDDLHRFNIAGMRRADFPFPASMKALIACKAAAFTDGDTGYWNVFDALQNAFFAQNRNIGSQKVIADIIKEMNIDFAQWKMYCDDIRTKEAVEKDLLLAEQYGIHSVPCLIINGKHPVNGAQSLSQIVRAVHASAEVTEESRIDGASCRLDGGKIECE